MSSKMLILNAQWPRILSAHQSVWYNLTSGALDLTLTLAKYPALSSSLKISVPYFLPWPEEEKGYFFFPHKGAVQSSPRASGTPEKPSAPLINAKPPNNKSVDSSSAHTQDNFKTWIIITPSTNRIAWLDSLSSFPLTAVKTSMSFSPSQHKKKATYKIRFQEKITSKLQKTFSSTVRGLLNQFKDFLHR